MASAKAGYCQLGQLRKELMLLLLLLLCPSQIVCVPGKLHVCLAVESSVCAHDSVCTHELTLAAATTECYAVTVHASV